MKTIFANRPGTRSGNNLDTSVPVLILGGKENGLSLTRSLGKAGIRVSVSGPADCWGLGSKYCAQSFEVPPGIQPKRYWEILLLGDDPAIAQRHVILPCSDDALEFLAHHEGALRERHIFDNAPAAQRLALLDKQETLEMAAKAGVGSPNFWPVTSERDIHRILQSCQFPLIIKPRSTFKFAAIFGTKFFVVRSGSAELREKIKRAHEHGFEVTVVEQIPGPDDLLSSYYTYVDDDGRCLFHFTKRIFRRYPVNRGGATYHATKWLPETAEAGLKFFRNTGFRGLGNIEFKRDLRDGKLKIIEVNARFTAAQELAVRSGVPIDLVVYRQLTGQPVPLLGAYKSDLRFWYPLRDFLSFLQLRRAGQLNLFGWLQSLDFKRHVYPLFDLYDLKPSLGASRSLSRKIVSRLAGKLFGIRNETSHSHTS